MGEENVFRGPLVKKPLGPGRKGLFMSGFWCIARNAADGPILCEICGTVHQKREKGYDMSSLLGLQVVDECCGVLIDRLFAKMGEDFAIAFLRDFAKDPCDSRFHIFLSRLETDLRLADQKIKMVLGQVQRSQQSLGSISVNLP